jgi:epoxyqueuosine reductase
MIQLRLMVGVYSVPVSRLTGELKECALAAGFDLVGVASADRARTADHLRAWLEAGMHGEMEWMATTVETRADLRLLLPGCRSVVAVAMSYRSSAPPSTEATVASEGRAWVSRYAWGRDYHKVLKRRLLRLGHWLVEQVPGAGWRVTVDTAPALEREWAARAGLGWIGKNTMLLNRRLGSELFLGLLLTDVELEPDAPATAHCGRCTACVEACPTGAFPRPWVLDARRCVAYLTVEHRGPVPVELEPAMATMVAGCDRCNEICPWTRRAPADLHPELGPGADRERPSLEVLEALDEEGYREWRQGSALTRIPFAAFRRNLGIARRNLQRSGSVISDQ